MASHLKLVANNPSGTLAPTHALTTEKFSSDYLFGSTALIITTRSPKMSAMVMPNNCADRITLGNNLAAEIAATGRSRGLKGELIYYRANLLTTGNDDLKSASQVWDLLRPIVDTKSLFQRERDPMMYYMYRPMIDATIGAGVGALIATSCGIAPAAGALVAIGLLFTQNWLAQQKARRVAQESPRSGFTAIIDINHEPLFAVLRGRHNHINDEVSGRYFLNETHPLTSSIMQIWNSKQRYSVLPATEWKYCQGCWVD